MDKIELNLNLQDMQWVVNKCIAEDYHLSMVIGINTKEPIYISLEKGSTYGDMHMKFSASGTNLLETFNKAYSNFPTNPVGGLWESKQLAPPTTKRPGEEVTDGEFTEVPSPAPRGFDDDIPF